MADVKIIDIDSTQWNIKDQEARNRIADIEENISTKMLNDISIQLKPDYTADNILFRNHYKVGKIHFIDIRIINIKGSNIGTDTLANITTIELKPAKITSFMLLDCRKPAAVRCILQEDGTIGFAESVGVSNGNNDIVGELIFAEA